MKKTYITPQYTIVRLKLEGYLATSLIVNTGDSSEELETEGEFLGHGREWGDDLPW